MGVTGRLRGVHLDLPGPEAAHFGGGVEEVGEGSLGFDAAVFEDDDVVGAAEGCAAMGDDEGRGVGALEEAVPELLLGVHVEAG